MGESQARTRDTKQEHRGLAPNKRPKHYIITPSHLPLLCTNGTMYAYL